MCNIAGYVGQRDAAPILIEMLKKQEGLAGGYYTGIATIHEGKLYYAKLEGDTNRLLALTEAERLPGKIGIIHSRSRSGGPGKWSHPFMHYDKNGNADVAYVANGASGYFRGENVGKEIAEELIKDGYPIPDSAYVENNIYMTLSSGVAVHMSDVMCQLIARNMDRGEPSHLAMQSAFLECPAEIVGLLLSLKTPDAISYARFNMPMSVAFSSHGAYLASAYFSMPEDCGKHTILPAGSCGRIYCDHFVSYRMPTLPASISTLDANDYARAYSLMEKMLSEKPCTQADMREAINTLFTDGAPLKQSCALSYELLGAFKREGRLVIEERRVESDFEGIDAPNFYMSLKK